MCPIVTRTGWRIKWASVATHDGNLGSTNWQSGDQTRNVKIEARWSKEAEAAALRHPSPELSIFPLSTLALPILEYPQRPRQQWDEVMHHYARLSNYTRMTPNSLPLYHANTSATDDAHSMCQPQSYLCWN